MVVTSINEKVKSVRKALGLSMEEFGKSACVTKAHISRIESAKGEPSEAFLKLICLTHGINQEYFEKNDEPMFVNSNSAEIKIEGSGFSLIPLYNVAASAGGGAMVHEENIMDQFAFKEDWIKHALGLNPKNLALISTIGDSMEPTLHPGDIILLDRSVEQVQNNAIYAIQVNGSLLVKRVQKKIDGSVLIKSDNEAYETEIVSGDTADSLKIIGRVVWAGRRF